MLDELFFILLPFNISQNLTSISIYCQCPPCPQIPESSIFDQVFPIITLIIGSLLTILANLSLNKLKEIKEIRRYEYVLIDDIFDIIKEANKTDLMVEYYISQKKDPRFVKTKHYKAILDFIQKTIKGENPDPTYLRDIYKDITKKI